MSKKLLYCLLFLWLCSCSQKKYTVPTVEIQTQFGNILVELYPGKAPRSVAAFLGYIDSGLYKKSSFYRVLKEENQPSSSFKSRLIQGGIWQSFNDRALRLPGIPHETTKQSGLLHTNGTISLARTEPGTASSEFFICIGDQPAYDYGNNANPDRQGYAAFGKVIEGMDIVIQIHSQPENGENFYPPVKILNIKKL